MKKTQPEEFTNYRKKSVQPMRPYVLGEPLAGITVSEDDLPSEGGMIAFNPANPEDQWYVGKQFFLDNYEPASQLPEGPVATAQNSGEPNQPTSNLPLYQQRVIDECEQLDEKLAKLQEFFTTELYAGLTHDKQHLMQCQANHMANYSQILHARIAEF